MDIRKLQRAIVDGLEDVKAQHIAIFDTEHLSPLFERVIIASGTSNRQTKALASSVRETVKSRGLPVLRVEGEDNGEWIIVDCGAAVAHIMQPAIRDYYRLEEIWGGKPVRVKLGGGPASLPKAAEPEPPAAGPARAGAAPRAAAKTAAAKPPAKKAAAKKAAAKKAAAKKAPAKKVPAKKVPVKKATAVPAAARKPGARPPAVERIVVKPARAAGAGKGAAQAARKTPARQPRVR
jgi:ribosome-associated protein